MYSHEGIRTVVGIALVSAYLPQQRLNTIRHTDSPISFVECIVFHLRGIRICRFSNLVAYKLSNIVCVCVFFSQQNFKIQKQTAAAE